MPKSTPIDKIIASIDKSIHPHDDQLLQKWIDESNENKAFFKAFSFIWKNSKVANIQFKPNSSIALQKVNKRIARRRFIRQTSKIAAIAIILLLTATIYWLLPQKTPITISAKTQQTCILPDSTKVILAQGSQIVYNDNYNKTTRQVKLVGKAWFDVVHNAERPFIVETSDTKTRVLGTQFTVEAYSNQTTKVYLDQGKVAFKSQHWLSKTILLMPGEMIHFTNEKYERTHQNNLNASAWATQTLRFKSTPLQEVITELEQYYNVKIKLQTKQIEQLRFSGTLKESAAQEALEIVALTLQLKLTHDENTLTLGL